MTKKFLIILMAAILIIPCAAFAKKKSAEIPMNERVRIAVEVTDATNFSELQTAEILRDKLIFQLNEKKLFNVVNPTAENFLAESKTLKVAGASDVGDLITFSTKDLPFNQNLYWNMGAQYVIRCEILGLGTAEETDEDFGLGNGIGIGIGTHGDFGVGVYSGVHGALRNYYCTAVNMQIVKVESGALIARKHFVGQAVKRRKPKKGYNDASDEAYLKSLDDTAKIVTKRVSTFVEKNIYNTDAKK